MNRAMLMAVLVSAAGGCATLKPHLGFEQVSNEVAQRTNLRAVWDTGSAEDQEARNAVASLLERDQTAETATQIALLNNRDLQALYEELQIAQAELVQAGLLKNPIFDGNIRFAIRGSGPAADLGVAEDFISILSLPLRKGRAQAAFEAQQLRVTAAVLDLVGRVRVAFYEAQASEQNSEMRRAVYDATAASYELAKRLRAAGNIRELDLSNELALYEQAKLDLASAESAVRLSRERLNELLGLWGEQTQWRMPARLPDLPTEEQRDSPPLERLAIERSVDLNVAGKELEIAGRTLGITGATRFISEASVGISAQREVADNRGVRNQRRREAYNVFGEGFTNGFEGKPTVWPPLDPRGAAHRYDGIWSVGPSFSVPVPIFDQGQAALASAQARLRQSAQRYFALAVRVRARFRAAYAETAAARDRAVYYKGVVLPLRHKIVEETQLQYNAMQVSAFQLLQAERDEIDVGAHYIAGLRDYWIARSRLDLILSGHISSESQGDFFTTHSQVRHGEGNIDETR